MDEDIAERASEFARRKGVAVECTLGSGKDGAVFRTNSPSAIKVHARRAGYDTEVACYRRLAERGVVQIRGHHIPQLIGSSDDLMVIEMTVVDRPFVLDFAGATLDQPLDLPAEIVAEWRAEMAERFEAHWPVVRLILAELGGRYGIHLLDVNPGNIAFD